MCEVKPTREPAVRRRRHQGGIRGFHAPDTRRPLWETTVAGVLCKAGQLPGGLF